MKNGSAGPSRLAWLLLGGRLTRTPELDRRLHAAPDLIIAADGGIRHAARLGVTPSLWVGDFDSSNPDDPRFAGIARQRVPRDKDFTDAELALRVAREQGAARVTLWGAFGGRLDHTLALALLAVREAEGGLETELHSGDESGVPLVPGRPLDLPAFAGQRLSIVALDELRGLSLAGVRWPLDGARVPAGSGWTVSNEATGGRVRAQVEAGRALLIQAWPRG